MFNLWYSYHPSIKSHRQALEQLELKRKMSYIRGEMIPTNAVPNGFFVETLATKQ